MRLLLCLTLAACAGPQNGWRGPALGDTHVTAVAADTNVTASRERTVGPPQVVGGTLHDAAPPQGWANPAPAAAREAQGTIPSTPSNVNTSPTGAYGAPSGADQAQPGADQPAAVTAGVVAPAIGTPAPTTNAPTVPTTPAGTTAVTSPNQVASPATYNGTDNGPGTGNQAATPATPRPGTQPAVPPVR